LLVATLTQSTRLLELNSWKEETLHWQGKSQFAIREMRPGKAILLKEFSPGALVGPRLTVIPAGKYEAPDAETVTT